MIKRKQLLVIILEKLIPYRKLAEGFFLLVQNSDDEDFINELYILIKTEIKQNKSQIIKIKLQEHLQSLREREEKSIAKDQAEAEKIFDDLLANID
jgi:hypothetical protein